MRKTVLAGIFALSASTAFAQTNPTPKPEAPAAVPTNPDAPQAAAGGPANLCGELLAFMKAPPPEADPAAAAKPAAAAAKPEAKEAAPAQKAAPAKQGSSALAGTTHSGDGASAKPGNEAGSSQKVTGQDGVATDAPAPSKEKVAAGSVANAPQKESRSAPLPPADVTSTPKESVMTVEEAETLAGTNDIGQCQDAARKMRVAGVAMPPPLIALTALDLQYQQAGAAQPQTPRTQEPAAQPAQ